MTMKTLYINDKKYSIIISQQNSSVFNIKINQIEQQAKLVKFDESTNILHFEVNKTLYKTQINELDNTTININIFNTKETIDIKTKENTTFTPTLYIKNSSSLILSKFKETLTSPLAGRIIAINVKKGQKIVKNQVLLIIESMKMENEILAENNAFVQSIQIKELDLVKQNQIIMTFQERETNAKTKNPNEKKEISDRRIS